MSTAPCRACGQPAPVGAAFCPYCGCASPTQAAQAPQAAPQAGWQQQPPQPYGAYPAYSPLPSGNDPAMLPHVQGWNWGAFVISWIWAFSHRLPGWGVGILVLNLASNIPVVGILPGLAAFGLSIYLGIKGNDLAWRQRPFQGVEHFRATERVWRTWGIVLFAILIAVIAIAIIVAVGAGLSESGRRYY